VKQRGALRCQAQALCRGEARASRGPLRTRATASLLRGAFAPGQPYGAKPFAQHAVRSVRKKDWRLIPLNRRAKSTRTRSYRILHLLQGTLTHPLSYRISAALIHRVRSASAAGDAPSISLPPHAGQPRADRAVANDPGRAVAFRGDPRTCGRRTGDEWSSPA
jgi:hypothetical protein